MTWDPFFPSPVILALAAAAAAAAVFAYGRARRRAPFAAVVLLGARLALLTALAVVLHGPARWPPPAPARQAADLVIALDATGSMQTADMDGQARYDFAVRTWLNDARLEEWGASRRLQFVHLDERARAVTLEEARRPAAEAATARRSLLARALGEAIAALPPSPPPGSAMLVLSDGRDSEEESFAGAAALARERGLPVHTVALGGPRLERDVHVVAVLRQPYLFAGEDGEISVRIAQSNVGRERTTLRVTHAGETHTRPVAFEDRAMVTVNLPIRHETAGTYEYHVAVDPVADEVELGNNAQVLFVQVSARRLRVLLAEGEPHWETRFLAHALRRDDRIALVQVSRLTAERTTTLASRGEVDEAALPATPEALDAFDVVILGRRVETVLPAAVLDYLPDYVDRRGGAVLFARGRATGPDAGPAVALIEPVTWPAGAGASDEGHGPGVWRPTSAGAMHPSFRTDQGRLGRALAELPPFERTAPAEPKPGARVLAELRPESGPPAPGLVAMEVGRGAALMLLSEGVWAWRLLAPRDADWRDLHDRFWSNTVRWLGLGRDFMPGEQVALRLSHQSADVGEAVTIDAEARFVDASRAQFRLVVRDPAGVAHGPALAPVEGDPRRQRARYVPRAPGVHTVVLEAPGLDPERLERGLNAVALDQERLQSAAAPGALRLLAEQSGGRVLDPRRPERFAAELARADAAAEAPVRAESAWDRRWVLFLLLSWAGAEWILRRFGGLL